MVKINEQRSNGKSLETRAAIAAAIKRGERVHFHGSEREQQALVNFLGNLAENEMLDDVLVLHPRKP